MKTMNKTGSPDRKLWVVLTAVSLAGMLLALCLTVRAAAAPEGLTLPQISKAERTEAQEKNAEKEEDLPALPPADTMLEREVRENGFAKEVEGVVNTARLTEDHGPVRPVLTPEFDDGVSH